MLLGAPSTLCEKAKILPCIFKIFLCTQLIQLDSCMLWRDPHRFLLIRRSYIWSVVDIDDPQVGYGWSWSVSQSWIKLIRKLLTDQLDPQEACIFIFFILEGDFIIIYTFDTIIGARQPNDGNVCLSLCMLVFSRKIMFSTNGIQCICHW